MESSIQKLKIVICGPTNTGKTYLANSLCFKNIPVEYIPTIGVEFYSTKLNENIKIHVWDISGQRKLAKITDNFIKLGSIILYTYSIIESNSFNIMKDIFFTHIKKNLINEDIKYIIVGTHFDRCDEQKVNMKDVDTFLDNNNLLHCRISSITKHNIDPLRQRIVNLLSK